MIIDSSFSVNPNYVFGGSFVLLDEEERAIRPDLKIFIFNFKTHQIEQQIRQDTISIGPISWGKKLLFSPLNRNIIGYSMNRFCGAKNNLETGISVPEYNYVIYPNPTTSIITLDRNCEVPLQSYTINDISGQLLSQEANIPPGNDPITINFSQYTPGIYFIRYKCGSTISVYKVIKQG